MKTRRIRLYTQLPGFVEITAEIIKHPCGLTIAVHPAINQILGSPAWSVTEPYTSGRLVCGDTREEALAEFDQVIERQTVEHWDKMIARAVSVREPANPNFPYPHLKPQETTP